MAEGPSRCVHGRGWILSGVLHLQILTLTRNIRTIKRILLSNTLERREKKKEEEGRRGGRRRRRGGGGGGEGGGGGKERGEKEEKKEEEGRYDSERREATVQPWIHMGRLPLK